MKFYQTVIAFLFLVVFLVSCGGQPAVDPEPGAETPAANPFNLVEALRAAGATVEPIGALEDPVFATKAETVEVNGEPFVTGIGLFPSETPES